MTERVSRVEAFLLVAQQLARLSSCHRRHVGCVLTDEHNRIVGLGYNGPASKLAHCTESCVRSGLAPGENIEACLAIHAEANALMHCTDIKQVHSCYIWGATPCWECAKLLCNSSVKQVFASSLYCTSNDDKTIPLFRQRGIGLIVIEFDEVVKARSNEPRHHFITHEYC